MVATSCWFLLLKSSVRSASGSGCKRMMSLVMTPNRPQLPARSLSRSNHATFLTVLPPKFKVLPSAVIMVAPRIWSLGLPNPVCSAPQELVATIAPIVEESAPGGSRGNHCLEDRSVSWSFFRVTPASNSTNKLSGSCTIILFILRMLMRRSIFPQSFIHASSQVPFPTGMQFQPLSFANDKTEATSSSQ